MSSLRRSFISLVLGLLAPLTLGACSTQPPRVSCERHLTPINVPAASSIESAPPKPGTHAAEGTHGR